MKALRILLFTLLAMVLMMSALAASCGNSGDDDDDDNDTADDDTGDDDIGDDDIGDDDISDDDITDDDITDDDTGDDDTGDDDTGDDDTGDDDTGDDDTGDDDTGDDDTGDDDTGDDDTVSVETIYDVQNGTITPGTTVTIENVVVTTPMRGDYGFFVQERPARNKDYVHEYAGIYIYLNFRDAESITVAQGDVINLTGEVAEYSNMTEIKVYAAGDVDVVSSGADLPSPYMATCAFFGGWEIDDSPEPYEGVLVKVEQVQVTYASSSGGVYWITEAGDALTENNVRVDDWWYDLDASVDDMYERIQGPFMQMSDAGGLVDYRIQPRSSADAVAATPPK